MMRFESLLSFSRVACLCLALNFSFGAAFCSEEAPGPKAKEGAKAAPAPAAPAAPEDWQKLETKPLALKHPRAMLSAGFFDTSLQTTISFPKDGSTVDTGLPHAGRDAGGKEYPPLKARLSGGFIWLDVNGDGKPAPSETRRIGPDGLSDPFNLDLHYADGTVAPYAFCFKAIVEHEKYALVRCMARSTTFQRHRIVLLDDNGNGLYNDAGSDMAAIDDLPPAFLGKYIAIGGDFYELLVHQAGTMVEIRPAPKLETGWVDMFGGYKASQKSEDTRIHGVVISGPQGSFSFDERHKACKVPAGPYDLRFALFERAKEWVYATKGEATTFNAGAADMAKPKWGGKVAAKFDLSSDGQRISVGIPAFIGEGTETYYPENYRTIPVVASIAQAYVDRMRIEHIQSFGQKRYEVRPDGGINPLEFGYFRNANDLYEVGVEYHSGIMGTVIGRQRIQFVFRRKDPQDAKAKK